jgi:hypothetical protein
VAGSCEHVDYFSESIKGRKFDCPQLVSVQVSHKSRTICSIAVLKHT